jgi:hypothetical protein
MFLRSCAADVAGTPAGKWREVTSGPFRQDSLGSLKQYYLGERGQRVGSPVESTLLWDGVPGHRFLHSRGRRFYDLAFVYGTSDFAYRDLEGEDPEPFLRRGKHVSLPFSHSWTAQPAGVEPEAYLEGVSAGTRDGAPARFRVEETHQVLCGLIGWGRVNRTRYVQILWIPIPIGSAD